MYSALLLRTVNVTVHNPSEKKFKEIYDKYRDTLKCPCSRVSAQYSEFAYFQVTFHEVCNSEFVSQEWIDEVYGANVSFIPPNDVRTILSHFWQLIRSFCTLTNIYLIDASNEFNSSNLVSLSAQPQHIIETKINTSLNFAINSAIINLKKNLLITRETILVNGQISILGTNYFLYIDFVQLSFYPPFGIGINTTYFSDGCSCENHNGCPRSAVVFEFNETSTFENIPGMMFDCLPLDGALASSFECFYDSWCLSLIQNVSKSNMRSEPLHSQSRFGHNTTLKTLLDELMIEQLTMTVVFSSYYSICNPKYCTYSYTHRFDILFIITFTASAFGGISVVLIFIAPLLIKLAYWIVTLRKRNNSLGIHNTNQSINPLRFIITRRFNLRLTIQNLLQNLNLFNSSSQNPSVIQRERFTTPNQTKIIIITNTTQDEYEQLWNLHSDTLYCPCSEITIPYSNFIQIIPIFHQLCSSMFISPEWFDELSHAMVVDIYQYSQFAGTIGAHYFKGLAAFCSIAEQAVNNSYRLFSAKTFISDRILPKNIFDNEVKILVDTFNESTFSELYRTFSLTRVAVETNPFASRIGQQVTFLVDNEYQIKIESGQIENQRMKAPGAPPCTCLLPDDDCYAYAYVYSFTETFDMTKINGLLIKCFSTESTLFSTLECWYNHSCVELVRMHYIMNGVTNIIDIAPLDENLPSKFSINDTIEVLINALLLENFTINISYDQYYAKCAPLSCIYTIEETFDFIFLITSILAIYAVLNKIFRLTLPFIVQLTLIIWNRIRKENSPPNQSTHILEDTQHNSKLSK
ncbi:unnamed protein product [Rotaria sp. Silwood2]|nr:unnamed protein product [Rotaria sp. Silwood2]CAF3045380.1 unnamed protein product [Rotaria sp. Silwood2]CAF4352441.1 unnamed protein product [Rotaria sp. Silwood2]